MFWILLALLLIIYSQGLSFEEIYFLFDKASYRFEVRNKEKTIYNFESGYGLRSSLFKSKRGDFLTPEGIYEIKSIRPSKKYYYFVELSYPNENDISWAYFRGQLKDEELLNINHLGNEIGIHGGGPAKLEGGKRDLNWTQGCIALKNDDLKSLLPLFKPGQRVFLIDSSKTLYEIIKKLAYPIKVKPLEFWEGELYLKLNNETYWTFHILEKSRGSKILTFREWIRGRLNREIISQPDGILENEKIFKETLIRHLHNIVEPKRALGNYLWK
ncbi:MAG: hypothetical protein C0197_01985 [Caldimicrobium thiodismutans]|uniref:L,D-TPase catalytic domain-containing protein n=1 Tax=Caldimicrobium thiodismutans TaxID=1653476 RepID=A0A2N7PKL8_9BACT|nr:MAG: hypothetical protein C0197_01985 [Caldimicrobium thiodismutans]